MATIIKREEDKKSVREGGKRLNFVLAEVSKIVKPGITTKELDKLAEKLIREGGDEPAFLNYTPDGANRPFPATLCVSINDEVVHGIPGERKLKEGDIVGLDLGLKHNGFVLDSAITVAVGKTDKKAEKLIETTKRSLIAGILSAKAGGKVGDISASIERTAGEYGIVRILGGHGVGKNVHESPFVPNYGKAGTGPILKEGLLLAVEPMLNEGVEDVRLDKNDGYTFRTADGLRSAHFEHTILIGKKGAEILT